MSQPDSRSSTIREQGPYQRSAAAQHQPLRPDAMHGRLPQEVPVAAHFPNPEPDTSADAHLGGTPRLDTARLERRTAFDLLAGEVSHELAHTLTFLRCLSEEKGPPVLSPEDGRMARNQIERLQRMLRHLRRLALPPPAPEPVQALEVLRRAEAGLAELLAARRVTLTWDTPERMTLRTDAPLFSVLIRDLLAIVVGGVKPAGTVGVQISLPSAREDGSIQIERSASGATRPLASHPADPWTAMLSDGADLGLALCHRVARTLGWELAVTADAGRESLRLQIPASSFCRESEP